MSLSLVFCTHCSALAVSPFLFHCSLPVPRAVTLVLFIPSATICSEGCCEGWFHAWHTTLSSSFWTRSSSSLEAALLGISTVFVTSHLSRNSLHCEVWSSPGHLLNTYVLELNPATGGGRVIRRKNDKIKSLVHIFDRCSQF